MSFARVGLLLAISAAPALAQSFQGLDLKPKKKKPTTLIVTGDDTVQGARLFIDGAMTGAIGEKMSMPLGSHTIKVERMGFRTHQETVEVISGANELKVSLVPETGIFSIDATEEGAVCSIDSGPEVRLPVITVLAPGKHQIRVFKEGFEPEIRSVASVAGVEVIMNFELRAAKDRPENTKLDPSQVVPLARAEPEVDVDLEREVAQERAKPAIYSRWYFWAGVAAAVGAGVAVGVVASQSQGKAIDATTVCGGPCDLTIGTPSGAIRF